MGAGGATVGYLAHGTATDHMWVKEGIPFVSTWEIYGDENAAFSECYRMFNPTTAIGRDREVSRWARAVARLLLELPTHPGVPGEIARAIDGRLRATPAPPVPSGQVRGSVSLARARVPGRAGWCETRESQERCYCSRGIGANIPHKHRRSVTEGLRDRLSAGLGWSQECPWQWSARSDVMFRARARCPTCHSLLILRTTGTLPTTLPLT